MDQGLQHLEENHFLATSVRRRWGLVAVGTSLLLLGEPFGLPRFNPWLVVLFAGLGAGTNILVGWSLKRDTRSWWTTYLLVLIDIFLVGIVVASIGPGGTILGFIYVVVPCFSRPERSLGILAIFTACLIYGVCVFLHPILNGETAAFNSAAIPILDVVLFLAVTLALHAEPYRTHDRIRHTNRLIQEVTAGKFAHRVPADSNDGFGLLEQSLNEFLSRTSQIVSDVGNKSESVASVGGAVSKHADRLEAALKRLLEQTTQLVGELSEQHDIADSGQNEAAVAAREASGILSNTEISQNETEQLLSVADLGIDRIEALQTAISTIRTDVKRAAGIITKLSDQSRQIGSFALAISKIARHTHVLALNAAIEAAHADEHGQGFAVVAEQVRTLAGEAGGSARDVSNLIGEVQAGIEDAAEVMVAGSERIERITMLTNEAHDTLDDMHMRASQLSQELSTSAEKSASQPRSLVGLTERLTILARFTEKCSREVEETKEMISVEASAIEDLQQASSQISGLAEEFRGILS